MEDMFMNPFFYKGFMSDLQTNATLVSG